MKKQTKGNLLFAPNKFLAKKWERINRDIHKK
jgi:hypothetical protein